MLDFRRIAEMAGKIPNVIDLKVDDDTVTFITCDEHGYVPFEVEKSYFETYIPTEYESYVIKLLNKMY